MAETGLHRSDTVPRMGAAMDGGERGGPADEPITLELLADLQAGLLDDATAARLRHRARTDPETARLLAALDRVRRDLARLGTDESSAADVPAAVTARVGAALQAAPPPAHRVASFPRRARAAHSVRRSVPRLQLFGALAGLCASVVAVGIGAVMLLRTPAPIPSAGPTAERITVFEGPRDIPLSDPQIVGLLTRSPDYGPLADPQRRASCLSGLGYSATTKVLGARPVDMQGRPAVLMVLPADTPQSVIALVVAPNCSAAGTELLASTVVTRP